MARTNKNINPKSLVEREMQRAKGVAGERIQHVVILMLENRSFDQMLGYLPGVNGVNSNTDKQPYRNYLHPQQPDPNEAFPVEQATYFDIPTGDTPPPVDAKGNPTDLFGGPSHSFPSASEQIYNDEWGPSGKGAKETTPPINSGFIKSYYDELMRTYKDWAEKMKDPKTGEIPPASTPIRDQLEVAMAAFSPEQLPVINGLAQEFCVCDQWFSEVPGPTEPNRLFTHAATSLGFIWNPWNQSIIGARTIYDDIDEQGDRTWAFYYYDLSDASNFEHLKGKIDNIRPFGKFTGDLKKPESFPNYVFLCPRYSNSKDGFANSQHAPQDVRYGEYLIADVYEALRNSAIWESTLLIIMYDEHGGFFDHVAPPDQNILPPDACTSPTVYDKEYTSYMFDSNGDPKPQYVFHFDRLGCRVPAVLVSPWIDKGSVVSRQLQHTSILATVRKMWGLRQQPLTAREGQAKPFDDLFEALASPRTDCPTKLTRPALPDVSLETALNQPLSPLQMQVFLQVTHLDGHPDSGKPVPMPRTQGEASAYIALRNKAHRRHHKRLQKQKATLR